MPEPVIEGRRVLGWRRLVLLPRPPAFFRPDQPLREHRDVSGGWLRPAVFGAMDGLVTNSSLIAGIGGGGGGHGAIALTGIAGLIAGAFSMATGEYISVTSQNELTAAEVELERMQHLRRPAVRVGDRAHQGEAEPGPPAAVGVGTGTEPVEDVGELARLDAAAGVADRDPDRSVPAGNGQLDEVAVTRVPDRVLQQRVHGEAASSPVRPPVSSRVSQARSARWTSADRKPVPLAADDPDRVIADLRPQPAHAYADDVGTRVEVVAPHRLQQLAL
jgi:hypothetical protein